MTELWRQSLPFNFAVQYKIENPTWTGEFEISDELFEEFTDYVSKQSFTYQIEGEAELAKFISIQKTNDGSHAMIEQAETLMRLLNESKKLDMIRHRTEISRVLINELAEKYYSKKEKLRYTFSFDNQLQDAIKLLNNIGQYNKILAIK
jgi:carboxyl-terminal processing protease